MKRKDFEVVARAINAAMKTSEEAAGMPLPHIRNILVTTMCDELDRNYSNFKRDIFRERCGVLPLVSKLASERR